MSESVENLLIDGYEQVECKLILLYLIDKMDIPMSYSQIAHFALEESYMNYFTLQQSLAEMVQVGYLEKTQDNTNTRYTVTDDGLISLEYFAEHIPIDIREHINQYVKDNRKRVKKDFEITANYFYDHINNEFTVKCGVYEEKNLLMEVSLSVVTREQARYICNNWKQNVNLLYGNILSSLTESPKTSVEPNEFQKTPLMD